MWMSVNRFIKSGALTWDKTRFSICVVDRVCAVQNGCQLKIEAFDKAITVNHAADIDC